MNEVTLSGPLFDGRAPKIIDRLAADIQDQIAQAGFDMIHNALRETLQHPTGAYESRINIDNQVDSSTVNDDRSVYGPWLEGTGSRNFPRTRFKGYANFRRVTDMLERGIAVEVAVHYTERAVAELNQ